MEIKLSKKKVIELTINNKECVAALDNLAIDHFQRTNKIGLLKALEELKNYNITSILKLLGSCIREKKDNKILGYGYFKQFDSLETVTALMPVIKELFPDNLPEPKDESEKN